MQCYKPSHNCMPLQPRYFKVASSVSVSNSSFNHVKNHIGASFSARYQQTIRVNPLKCHSTTSCRRYHIPPSTLFVRVKKHVTPWLRWDTKAPSGKRWNSSIFCKEQLGQPLNVREQNKDWTTRTIEVPVGGNGNVSLDISTFLPANRDHTGQQRLARDLIVYLPPGNTFQAVTRGAARDNILRDYEHALETLAPSDGTRSLRESVSIPTVVRINYRLDGTDQMDDLDYRFPCPVHDVSVAFEWIENHLSELCSISSANEQQMDHNVELNDQNPRIYVFGTHIGGSLALMLALTQPNAIHAVAVYDPIIDWVGLDELAASEVPTTSASSTKRRSKVEVEETRLKTQEVAFRLINLRTRLFRNPSGFFDAFASPLMFLRAPGRDTPLWRTARPEIEGAVEDTVKIVEAMKRDGGVEVDELETKEVIQERGYGPYDDDWHTAEPESEFREGVSFTSTGRISKSSREQITSDLSTLSLNGQLLHSSSIQSETDLTQPAGFSHNGLAAKQSLEAESLSSLCTTTDLSKVPGQPIAEALSTSQSQTPNAMQSASSIPSRRRKVIRRWPPVGRPEDYELPFVKIYTTLPCMPSVSEADQDALFSTELAYVLHPQAKEMADVMRRACFWGREKSFAEDKVGLETVFDESVVNEDYQQVEVLKHAMNWLQFVGRTEE